MFVQMTCVCNVANAATASLETVLSLSIAAVGWITQSPPRYQPSNANVRTIPVDVNLN